MTDPPSPARAAPGVPDAQPKAAPPRLCKAHAHAQERGASDWICRLVRMLLTPLLRLWFRLRISGAEHLPGSGPAIIAANHKSFLDPFIIGFATRREVRYMAKAGAFRGPLGWLLPRLGAFPVRRGEADTGAMETALEILAQGGVVVIFPEGTVVVEADALGSPHSGAGRLALASGAPIVPAAIVGTSRLWLGPIPKRRRVQLAFLPAIDAVKLPLTGDGAAELMDRWVWPAVRREYGRLYAQEPRLLGKLAPRRRFKLRGGAHGRAGSSTAWWL